MALEVSSQRGKQTKTVANLKFEEVFREEMPRLVEQICQNTRDVEQTLLQQNIWHMVKELRGSPEMASEDISTFLQHCFTTSPVVARDFALLHNKHAASLDLNKPTNTISFSLRSQPPRTRSSAAADKQVVPLQSPLRQVVGDDEDSETSSSPKTRKTQRGKGTPTKESKPQWHEALTKFTKDLFEEDFKELNNNLDTVPFKIIFDPAFLEVLPGMLQCFFLLLDSKFGHDEGTSASHLDATISILQHAGDVVAEFANSTKLIRQSGSQLEDILRSAKGLANSFSDETMSKPSTWSEQGVVQRRGFCRQAVDFARTSLYMTEELVRNNGERGFGAGGARGEKRPLEEDDENETGNEKGPKRRRMLSPHRLRHRRR
jgi:hypothetical protein